MLYVPDLVGHVCQESRRKTPRGILAHLDNARPHNNRENEAALTAIPKCQYTLRARCDREKQLSNLVQTPRARLSLPEKVRIRQSAHWSRRSTDLTAPPPLRSAAPSPPHPEALLPPKPDSHPATAVTQGQCSSDALPGRVPDEMRSMGTSFHFHDLVQLAMTMGSY
jgi:hypothetical protein